METYLTSEILKALGEGDIKKGIAWLAVFVVIWLEVRGLKKAVKALGNTVTNSFAAGEKRFDTLEHQVKEFEHRITMLETKPT